MVRQFTLLPTLIVLFCLTVILAAPFGASAQPDQIIRAPDTIDEAREGAVNIAEKILGIIPSVVARIWKEEAVPRWNSMGEWAKTEIWEKRLLPAFHTATDRAKELLISQIEKRKPVILQELEKEKQELLYDKENTGKEIWERFKALFSQ